MLSTLGFPWVCSSHGQEFYSRVGLMLSVRVLTHQKTRRRFCMLFFEVLPLTTLAVSVNGKTSKKSVQK